MSEALNHLAGRVADDPSFLANPLAEFGRSESLDEAGLARTLGCNAAELARLRLCRAPRPDPEGFRADVGAVAARFNIDPVKLANVVRRGLSLALLRGRRVTAGEPGVLLAARDDDIPSPPPAGGDT